MGFNFRINTQLARMLDVMFRPESYSDEVRIIMLEDTANHIHEVYTIKKNRNRIA